MKFREEIIGDCRLILGDCRQVMPSLNTADLCIADPPYGDTSLDWDTKVSSWAYIVPTKNLWCFGSMRFFLSEKFDGWKYAQEIVWEKHNGSGFQADRFKRVHELAVQFYRGKWEEIFKQVVTTPDATARAVRRNGRPVHCGNIEATPYASEDGGPRMMRSVIYARSCHGYAEHPTQKPVEIIAPLIDYSTQAGDTVFRPVYGVWFGWCRMSASRKKVCWH